MLEWWTAPTVSSTSRSSAVGLTVLRVMAGLLWLYNVRWKNPPGFGEPGGSGLYKYTKDAVDHPVLAPYSWVVEHLVLPNFTAFGWAVLVVETLLAVLLLTGSFVRLAALLGVAQSLAIGLSVAQTPGEWPWSYAMMVGIHVALLLTASGALFSVDALRANGTTRGPGQRSRVARLLAGWGLAAGVVGVLGFVASLGDDVLATRGAIVGKQSLQFTLGSYNLVGAVVLVATGVLMVLAGRASSSLLALSGGLLAALAALTLYAQITADPWLGGTNSSAAVFASLAVIGVVSAQRLARAGTPAPGEAEEEGTRRA